MKRDSLYKKVTYPDGDPSVYLNKYRDHEGRDLIGYIADESKFNIGGTAGLSGAEDDMTTDEIHWLDQCIEAGYFVPRPTSTTHKFKVGDVVNFSQYRIGAGGHDLYTTTIVALTGPNIKNKDWGADQHGYYIVREWDKSGYPISVLGPGRYWWVQEKDLQLVLAVPTPYIRTTDVFDNTSWTPEANKSWYEEREREMRREMEREQQRSREMIMAMDVFSLLLGGEEKYKITTTKTSHDPYIQEAIIIKSHKKQKRLTIV